MSPSFLANQDPPMPQGTPLTGASAVATLAGIHVSYGRRTVLQGLDLTLRAGEIFALLGRNGTGKSTLMRLLTGQMAASAGEVRVFGADPRRTAEPRRLMSLVPQEIALYPRLTVRENLEVLGGMMGLRRTDISQRVEEAMILARLEERRDDLVEHLSGGYKRRANIAAALLTRPRLLLLDEPTVGVDVEARLSLHRTLRDLRNNGTAILLTTHDLDEVRALSDRVGILAAGRLAEEGPIGGILQRIFGERREVVLALSREPDTKKLDALRRLGFEPTPNPLEWSCWVGGPDIFGALQSSLTRSGIDLHEIRLREPGLEHVLSRVEEGLR